MLEDSRKFEKFVINFQQGDCKKIVGNCGKIVGKLQERCRRTELYEHDFMLVKDIKFKKELAERRVLYKQGVQFKKDLAVKELYVNEGFNLKKNSLLSYFISIKDLI